MKRLWVYIFCFKAGSTLHEWGTSRIPSPLLTITIQTPPLVLTSEEFKVLLDFLTFHTGPDIRLNKRQVSEIPGWQMLLFVRQLTVLEGKQAGPMKWTFCSYRLGPASSLLMSGSNSLALLLFFWAKKAAFPSLAFLTNKPSARHHLRFGLMFCYRLWEILT